MRRRPSPVRGRAFVLLITLSALGCGKSPDATELAQTTHSWGATAVMVVDRWQHGAVSRRFAALTLDRAASELQSLRQEGSQLPDTVDARRAIDEAIASTLRAVRDADSAAVRDDRPAAVAAVAPLDPGDSLRASLDARRPGLP